MGECSFVSVLGKCMSVPFSVRHMKMCTLMELFFVTHTYVLQNDATGLSFHTHIYLQGIYLCVYTGVYS